MHTLTIQFRNGADQQRFRRFVETCQKIDGTPDALRTSIACSVLRDSALPDISEEEETRRGEILVSLLNLKPIRPPEPGSDAPRYRTEWGSKTALGLFRTVDGIITGELPRDTNGPIR